MHLVELICENINCWSRKQLIEEYISDVREGFFDRVPVVWIIKRQENLITWEKYDRWWLYDCHHNVKSLIWLNPDGCFSLQATECTVGYHAIQMRMEEQTEKKQPEHLKMCTFNFVPLRWGELFQVLVRNEGRVSHQSMTQLHLSSLNTIMCNQSYSTTHQLSLENIDCTQIKYLIL